MSCQRSRIRTKALLRWSSKPYVLYHVNCVVLCREVRAYCVFVIHSCCAWLFSNGTGQCSTACTPVCLCVDTAAVAPSCSSDSLMEGVKFPVQAAGSQYAHPDHPIVADTAHAMSHCIPHSGCTARFFYVARCLAASHTAAILQYNFCRHTSGLLIAVALCAGD